MTDQPQILITPKTLTCPGHGEHFRAQWPAGWMVFSLTIMQAMLESEALQEECGFISGKSEADISRLNGVLEKKPACYFVERGIIRKAYMESGIGCIGTCSICNRSGMGGPYSINVIGRLEECQHVCFECALDTGERIHIAHPNGGVWHE